ncbi:MAG: WecB/TagA/CpsF family glycosyltransferase [Chitinophagaceae bacterium]|nr:WecB/TagA/CpsF family glycosyltransferase [Chitinophagaceae bacterium]
MQAVSQPRVDILGTPIDNMTMQQTLNLIENAIETKKSVSHTVVNAGKIVLMHQDAQLKQSVVTADIINADGQGVVWASRILGQPIVERVTGIDLMDNLVALAYRKKYKIFFFGAKDVVLNKVIEHYSNKYSPDIVAGYRNGYFKKSDERSIAQQIADSGAQMLFVAITSPIKENFLYENRDLLQHVNFTMGVGGSFDVIAGHVKRAPLWMQHSGLEWAYRVYQEPKRMFKRYMVGNWKFMTLVLRYRFNLAK